MRCDALFPSQKVATYVNLSLDQCSHIEYILVSKVNDVTCFTVLDPDVNLSYHLPLFVELSFSSTARPDLRVLIRVLIYCLQCFDAVGWAAGRASGL